MKQYLGIEREVAIIKRALNEFDFDALGTLSIDNVYEYAKDCILDNVHHDYISVGHLENNTLYWSDNMGFMYYEEDPVPVKESMRDYYRFNTSWCVYEQIDFSEADLNKDYVLAARVVDSEARVAIIVVKNSDVWDQQ